MAIFRCLVLVFHTSQCTYIYMYMNVAGTLGLMSSILSLVVSCAVEFQLHSCDHVCRTITLSIIIFWSLVESGVTYMYVCNILVWQHLIHYTRSMHVEISYTNLPKCIFRGTCVCGKQCMSMVWLHISVINFALTRKERTRLFSASPVYTQSKCTCISTDLGCMASFLLVCDPCSMVQSWYSGL